MKKLLLTLTVIGGLFSLSASAQTFTTDDGLTYNVTGSGEVELAKPSKAYAIAKVVIPATVSNGGTTYKVTSIAKQAFMSNATIESLVVGSNVVTINEDAFMSCSKLTSIDLGNVKEIKSRGLYNTGAEVIVIPNSVTTMGDQCLRANSKLVKLTLSENLEAIPYGLCWGNTKMKGPIVIGDKATSIGESAFASCSAIDTVVIGEGMKEIATKAFAYASQIKEMTVKAPTPPTVGENGVYEGTLGPKCVLLVPEKSLELYQKTEPWSKFVTIRPYDSSGSKDDDYFVMAGIGYKILSRDNALTVGVCNIDTLKYTGDILIKSTVFYAGENWDVVSVEADAFKGCTGVTQVELPASVAAIGNNAFNGCSGLKYLISRAGTPPTLGTTVFTGVNTSTCKLFVDMTGASAYKAAAQWKDFTNTSLVFDEVTVDGLTYTMNNVVNGYLTFTKATGFKGDLVIPDKVMVEGFPFSCTVIGRNAFYNTTINTLKLPSTLKAIEGSAFFSCGQYSNPIPEIVVPEGTTSIGNNAFYGCYVKHVELPKKSLTELAGSAFYACDIDGIEIPGSVGVINSSTFYGSDMTWVVLGEGITEIGSSAFWATKLGCVRLPSTMKKIGDNAFGATSISSLTINEGLESVAENAFSNCTYLYKIFNFATKLPTGITNALTNGSYPTSGRATYSVSNAATTGAAFGTVYVRSDLNTWFDYKGIRYLPESNGSANVIAVDGSYLVTDREVELAPGFSANGKNYTVTKVGNYLLCGQGIMRTANITYPFTTLPDGFVYNAVKLNTITLPQSVTALGAYSLAWTDSLTTVELPENLQTIGLAAMYYSGLKEVTIPSKVTLIDNAAMAGMRNLNKLTFADGKDNVLIGWFPTMMGNRPMFASSKLDEVVIGRNLDYFAGASYGYSPFYGDSIVTKVTFTNTPDQLGQDLFRECKSIKELSVGDNVFMISQNAFDGCASLESIYLGSGLTGIMARGFGGATNVKELYCANPNPPAAVAGAITDIPKNTCTLYVPTASIDKYKAANQWKEFFNIEGFTPAGVDTTFGDVVEPGRYVVYNMNGILVLDTKDESLVKNLPAGIYVINGKKYIKK